MNLNTVRALSFTPLLVWILCIALATTGCKSKRPKPAPPPPVAMVSMRAKADANPGPEGPPSPIVLRLYQLKTDATFNNCDYFPLFNDEKKVLGGDLVSRDERELSPGQTLSLEMPFAPETRFIGVAAGYHNIDAAAWRAIAPAPGNSGHSVHVTAVAERARVTLSVAQ